MIYIIKDLQTYIQLYIDVDWYNLTKANWIPFKQFSKYIWMFNYVFSDFKVFRFVFDNSKRKLLFKKSILKIIPNYSDGETMLEIIDWLSNNNFIIIEQIQIFKKVYKNNLLVCLFHGCFDIEKNKDGKTYLLKYPKYEMQDLRYY